MFVCISFRERPTILRGLCKKNGGAFSFFLVPLQSWIGTVWADVSPLSSPVTLACSLVRSFSQHEGGAAAIQSVSQSTSQTERLRHAFEDFKNEATRQYDIPRPSTVGLPCCRSKPKQSSREAQTTPTLGNVEINQRA